MSFKVLIAGGLLVSFILIAIITIVFNRSSNDED